MPDDGLSRGRNTQYTCEGTILMKTNLRCVGLYKCSLLSNKHNGIASIKIAGYKSSLII